LGFLHVTYISGMPRFLQQQGREFPSDTSEADLAVMQQIRPLIISGEPYTERKSTFQVGRQLVLAVMHFVTSLL
jgi:hypothetical protein